MKKDKSAVGKVVVCAFVLLMLGSMFAGVMPATAQPAPEEEWNKTFGGSDYEWGWSVQQTSDSGYIIAGLRFDGIWLIKTDANGNKQWDKTHGGGGPIDQGCSVQQTTDGGYIIAGKVWLIKTYTNGNEKWNKTFGGSSVDRIRSVQQTSDGGYIIAGDTYGAGLFDGRLIKTDANGNKQWEKIFSGSSGDHLWSVRQTTDGGYITAGGTSSYGAGRSDVWLIKLAPEAEVTERTFYDVWNVDRHCGIHGGTEFNDRINDWSNAYTGPETNRYKRAAKYLDQEGIDTINIVAHVRGGGWWTQKIKEFLAAIDNTGVNLKVILDLEPEPTWSQQDVLNNIDTTINIAKKPDGKFYPSVIGISLDMEYLGGTGTGTDTLNKVRNKIVNDNPPLNFFPIWYLSSSKNDLNGMANKDKVIPLYDGFIDKTTQTYQDGHNAWVNGQVKYMKNHGFAQIGVMPISYEIGTDKKKHSIALKTWFIYKHAVNYAGGVDYFLLGSGIATEDPLGIYTKAPILDTGRKESSLVQYYVDVFPPEEEIYLYGSTDQISSALNVYVVNDAYPFPNRVPGTQTTLTTDTSGKILPGQVVWNSAKMGKYDIIVDVNKNGIYDEGLDAIDDMDVNDAGFEVIPEFTTIAIPVAAIIELLFLFSRRKKKEEEV